MSKGRFCYHRCAACVQPEVYRSSLLVNSDDNKKAPIQCRRGGFATLDELYVFEQRCASDIYFGIVTTPRRLHFKVEGGGCHPRCVVCFRPEMYLWSIPWNSGDTKKAPLQSRRGGVSTLAVLYVFDQRCTSGVYFGFVTAPRKLHLNVEGKESLHFAWLHAFDQRCSSGLYFGIMTKPRGLQFNAEWRFCYPRIWVCFQPDMYFRNILWNNDHTEKAPIQCRREGFVSLDVLYVFDQRCTFESTRWNNDDTKEVPIQCRRQYFVTLDVLCRFDQRCISEAYFGIVTTPRSLQLNVEREVLLPLMCSMLSTRHVLLEYTL